MIIDEDTLHQADQIAARHLRDARVAAGVSVTEAAKAFGVDAGELEAWEAGERSADAIVALAMLKRYGADGQAMLREVDELIAPSRNRE